MTFFKQVLTFFLIAGAILTTGLTAAVDNPRVIEGYPLRITVYDDSTMHVAMCDVNQYNPNSKGSSLLMYNCKLQKWGGGHNTFVLYNDVEPIHFTPVSNTLVDPFTISTVYLAGMTNEVQVTQTVSYTNGTPFYKIVWEVTNNGAETYTDLRFRHGGDTSFKGDDSSIGNWAPDLGMVYVTKSGSSGYMGLYGALGYYGDVPSPANNYAEYLPPNVESYMTSRFYLNNLRRDVDHDAAYALEWLRDTLAPGESWTVTAYERWSGIDCGPGPGGIVEVIPEPGEGCDETITVHFQVLNWQETADTFDLTVTSQNGWAVNLTGNNPITVNPGGIVPVDVELTIPLSSTDDVLTLTATSQSDPTLFASGDANINATCVVGCTEGNKASIDSPNAGGTFNIGDPLDILWSTNGVPPEWQNGTVRISLWQYENGPTEPPTQVGRIDPDRQPVMAGQHIPTWIINKVFDSSINQEVDVEPGDNYAIKIREIERRCHDYSDVLFSIVGCRAGEKALLVYPNQLNGTETFDLGQEVEIEWSADNVPPPLPGKQERVRLSLWTDDEQTQIGRITLPDVDVRQEVFSWTINQVWDSTTSSMIDVVPGTYKLKIREVDRGCHHFSDMFIIGGAPGSCLTGEKAQIVSPNGGETFELGQEMTVTWLNGPDPVLGRLRLSLWVSVNGEIGEQFGRIEPDNIIAVGAEQQQQHTWTIDQVYDKSIGALKPVVPGTYFVKIREKDRSCHDYGDAHITILPSTTPEPTCAQLTYPSGGETFAMGTQETITWTIDPTSALVKISLWTLDGQTQIGLIGDNLDPAAQAFNWTVGSLVVQNGPDIVPGTQYLVKIKTKGELCHFLVSTPITIIDVQHP